MTAYDYSMTTTLHYQNKGFNRFLAKQQQLLTMTPQNSSIQGLRRSRQYLISTILTIFDIDYSGMRLATPITEADFLFMLCI
jgi:hypothetical protein